MSIVSEFKVDPTSTRRTVYGSMLQTALTLRVPMVYLPKSTLNEKFNVQFNVLPPADQYGSISYFSFGRGGAYSQPDADGVEEILSYVHEPSHGGNFAHMPFVLRTLDNDLTPTEREKFRMRSLYNVGGVQYYRYDLCVLDKSDTTIEAFVVTPDATGDVSTEFIPTSEDLNPTPVKPSIDSTNVVSGPYMTVKSVVKMVLTQWMIDEILNAKQILTGNSTLDINEIMIVQGYDSTVTSTDGGQSVTYTEALVAQAAAFFPNRISINNYAGNILEMSFNAGIDDPLALTIVNP